MKQIVLASQSPRRKELLQKVTDSFITDPADIDETMKTDVSLEEASKYLAYQKAASVLERHPDSIVIGSDTIVTRNGVVLGKPQDEEDAFRMLKDLEGNTHQVMTSLCILSKDRKYCEVSVSGVTFASMSDEEIRAYIATGETSDKAGAYAIQGFGGRYITNINGDYYSIMGLPLNLLYEEFKNIQLY